MAASAILQTHPVHSSESGDTTPAASFRMDRGLEKDSAVALDDSSSQNAAPETVQNDAASADPEKAVATISAAAAAPPAPPAMTPPPDGGTPAWLTVAGAFCSLFVSFGLINCIGVFQAYYETHQLKEYSPSTVAWITSLETFMMFFGGPIFGTLWDNFGPRWVLLFGTFLEVFGLMMASISTKYWHFLLSQGLCSSLGASAVFFASISSVSTWFARRRALALGITASGSSLGGVIFPIMVARLIPRVGFGWAMRACAFLVLGLLVVANLTIRSRLVHTRKPFHIMNFVRPLGELRFALTVLAGFFFMWGLFLPLTFIITSAERWGMSPDLAAYVLPILNAVSIFGRTLPGYLADRFGRFNVMIITSFFCAIIVVAIWLPGRGNAATLVFAALYGFGSGAFVSLGPALIAQISDLRQLGVRSGTFFALVSVAALTGTPIGGALVPDALHGSYLNLQIFSAVVMFVGAVLFVGARIAVGGSDIRKSV